MELIIFGAGGLAREVLWLANDVREQTKRKFNIKCFIDENPANKNKRIDGLIIRDYQWLESNLESNMVAICGIGNPIYRKKIDLYAQSIGLQFTSLIHPTANLSSRVNIGVGVVITAGNVLTTNITLGNHVFLNLSCTVGHDTTLKKYVNCAPGCNISGNVVINEGAHLGTGTKVIQHVSIGEWSTLGAGAVVTKDVPQHTVSVGVPAQPIRQKSVEEYEVL